MKSLLTLFCFIWIVSQYLGGMCTIEYKAKELNFYNNCWKLKLMDDKIIFLQGNLMAKEIK